MKNVDDYIKAQMRAQHIPGLSLAVVRDGKIIKAKGYGFANLEWSVPVTTETVFQSGSVGKQFTATAVMMLVEDGKISLEDKISQYLEDTPEAWKDITIHHLLTHTSGIGEVCSVLDLRQNYIEAELVKKAASVPVKFALGEKWQYSNTGYVLLGVLIHKVSGKFYGDFLKERIFTPLGMDTARNISEEDIIPHRAAGYHLVKGELKNQGWVPPTWNTTADGSLYLTSLDMAKWDRALYTEHLLKKASLDQMWTPVKLNDGTTHPYGFSWRLGQVNGHKIIEHDGAWQGFLSHISRYVEDKTTVIVFVNTDNAHSSAIVHTVASLSVPALAPPTRTETAQ
jgi:CubicO group peptidase (beta-lactamase class C family)